LIALGGSPIGLGADGGGSIRSPAAGTGLFGMKATSERIPIFRGSALMRGCKSFPIVAGALCKTAEDSEYFMATVLAAEPWKTAPSIVPIPWRQPELTKVVIGVYNDDDIVMPHPPILHALEVLVEKLRAHPQFEVVEWKPYKHGWGYDLLRQLYWEDGGVETRQVMLDSGEPILPLTQWVMKESHVKPRTLKESWELNYQRDEYLS
jgi:amidase